MYEQGIAPPPDRQRWNIRDMPIGSSRWFSMTETTGPKIRAAANYAGKKVGGRFKVAISYNGAERGYRVWRVA